MPSAIPDRFKLEMRLGRDGDVEEWLATDTSLDRPVLIRTLGPETSPARREQFLQSVGAVAAVSHTHLAKVYMVEQVEGGAYGVFEWTGGSSLSDHVRADRSVALAEFLPNAAGLAGAVAALHEKGVIHGAIDLSAISYSSAHPARLGAFGRVPSGVPDVVALATSLEEALTGLPPGGPPPSERIDGVSPAIDRILRLAQTGEMTAAEMEKALAAAPTPRAPEPRVASRRLIYSAVALLLVAVGLIVVGSVLTGGSNEPVLPTRATTTTLPPESTTSTTAPPSDAVRVLAVTALDPSGAVAPDDPSIQLVIDGDTDTLWTTPQTATPVTDGPGLVLSVSGMVRRVELVGLPAGTGIEMRWASSPAPDPNAWQVIARATSMPGATIISLPSRTDGHWLIWFTRFPPDGSGGYRAGLAEVRFNP